MSRTSPVTKLLTQLDMAFPEVECELTFSSPLQLLVATILSAQCTDVQVNRVTPQLFAKYRSAADFANADIAELESLIHATGFYHTKAQYIKAACQMLVSQYSGEVPREIASLTALPGVGRKTANVVLGTAFGIAEGIVVDTHVTRIAARLGLTKSRSATTIERDLMACVPRDRWIDISHLFIRLGRTCCTARVTKCGECPVKKLCPSATRVTKPKLAVIFIAICLAAMLNSVLFSQEKLVPPNTTEIDRAVDRGLAWLAGRQSVRGGWDTPGELYPTAMTGMAGLAILMEGSTVASGRYANSLRDAVDFLLDRARPNGLIGEERDDRYTYGHGFGMLFLSQVLGEEDDAQRREEIIEALTRGVVFCGKAQTRAGGWGYVSAQDGRDFDEGSTTITQVQALRGARNAGIPVPKVLIDRAVAYIHKCAVDEGRGGIAYNIHGGGGRPPISAAAIACLFSAGEYDDTFVPAILKYCDATLFSTQDNGHWHYGQYYFAQVKYREGGEAWEHYRAAIFPILLNQAKPDGSWDASSFGTVYTTAIALAILQLDRAALPIYQR